MNAVRFAGLRRGESATFDDDVVGELKVVADDERDETLA
jgi:hypothetical protein